MLLRPRTLPTRALKITFICPVFPPEPDPSGVMASQLACRLASEGHQIAVVTSFPNRPLGAVYDGYRRRSRSIEREGSLSVVRCATWLIGAKRRLWNRVMENVTFGILSVLNAWRFGRPDVLVLETWPLLAVQIGTWLGRWWRVPVVYYVQDVYPEAAESAGLLRTHGPLSKLLRSWDRRLCLKSGKVIAISDTMRDLLCRNRAIPPARITVMPNWVDREGFPRETRGDVWRSEMGIAPDVFVAMYAGTMGLVSGSDVLVDVAKRLETRTQILILCIGEGSLKRKMIRDATREKLRNIRFEPFQPRRRLAEVHAAANATLLTLSKDSQDASVPSKMVTYLAAGRPIVCAVPEGSSISQELQAAQAGVRTPPGDPDSIARAITLLAGRPREARQMGENGRNYFEKHLTFDRACRQFHEVLEEVAESANTAHSAPLQVSEGQAPPASF